MSDTATLDKRLSLTEQDLDRIEENSKQWWKQMTECYNDIKQQLKDLPEKITNNLAELTDLKITTYVQALEIKISRHQASTYRWIIGLCITVVMSLAASLYGLIK